MQLLTASLTSSLNGRATRAWRGCGSNHLSTDDRPHYTTTCVLYTPNSANALGPLYIWSHNPAIKDGVSTAAAAAYCWCWEMLWAPYRSLRRLLIVAVARVSLECDHLLVPTVPHHRLHVSQLHTQRLWEIFRLTAIRHTPFTVRSIYSYNLTANSGSAQPSLVLSTSWDCDLDHHAA